MLAQDYQALDNNPIISKQFIHAVDMHGSDYIMTCNMEMPSVAKNTKKTNFSATIFNESTSTYYDNKYDGFGMLSKQYKANCVNNINQTSLIK